MLWKRQPVTKKTCPGLRYHCKIYGKPLCSFGIKGQMFSDFPTAGQQVKHLVPSCGSGLIDHCILCNLPHKSNVQMNHSTECNPFIVVYNKEFKLFLSFDAVNKTFMSHEVHCNIPTIFESCRLLSFQSTGFCSLTYPLTCASPINVDNKYTTVSINRSLSMAPMHAQSQITITKGIILWAACFRFGVVENLDAIVLTQVSHVPHQPPQLPLPLYQY